MTYKSRASKCGRTMATLQDIRVYTRHIQQFVSPDCVAGILEHRQTAIENVFLYHTIKLIHTNAHKMNKYLVSCELLLAGPRVAVHDVDGYRSPIAKPSRNSPLMCNSVSKGQRQCRKFVPGLLDTLCALCLPSVSVAIEVFNHFGLATK